MIPQGIVISLVIVLLCIYLPCRYDMAYEYKTDLNYRCYEVCIAYIDTLSNDDECYENFKKHWTEIVDIPYVKMILMFWRPLEDEYWLTEEQIDFLNGTNA